MQRKCAEKQARLYNALYVIQLLLLRAGLQRRAHSIEAVQELCRQEPLDQVRSYAAEDLSGLVSRLAILGGTEGLPALGPNKPRRQEVLPSHAPCHVVEVGYLFESLRGGHGIVHCWRDMRLHEEVLALGRRLVLERFLRLVHDDLTSPVMRVSTPRS